METARENPLCETMAKHKVLYMVSQCRKNKITRQTTKKATVCKLRKHFSSLQTTTNLMTNEEHQEISAKDIVEEEEQSEAPEIF